MRILIVDDHEIVRRGLKQTLADEFGGAVFGEAANAAEALALVWKQKWDLTILDISLPGRNGLEVLASLKKARPKLPVLVLSMLEEADYGVRVLKAGAAGFVSKQGVSHELIAAVKKALTGAPYVTPTLAERLAADLGTGTQAPPHEKLSDREWEVMKLLAAGQSVKAIAATLSLSDKTVFTYRARLLEKLDLKTVVELVRYALKHRLVE